MPYYVNKSLPDVQKHSCSSHSSSDDAETGSLPKLGRRDLDT